MSIIIINNGNSSGKIPIDIFLTNSTGANCLRAHARVLMFCEYITTCHGLLCSEVGELKSKRRGGERETDGHERDRFAHVLTQLR